MRECQFNMGHLYTFKKLFIALSFLLSASEKPERYYLVQVYVYVSNHSEDRVKRKLDSFQMTNVIVEIHNKMLTGQ